jgi:hypothetical protein
MKRIQPVTVLLLALILVLGYSLVTRQRRTAWLEAALAQYKRRAQGDVERIMGHYFVLAWPDGITLSEAIEPIRQATSRGTSFPKGVPIYVDADGLREARRSLNSPVKAPPLHNPNGPHFTLRQQLRMTLEPLGLAAEAKDGAIVITSRNRVDESAADSSEE